MSGVFQVPGGPARLGEVTGRASGSWRQQAACVGRDPNLFFADYTGQKAKKGREAAERRQRTAMALAICRVCPVRLPCLEDAMEWARRNAHDFGVRGGYTAEERQTLRRMLRMGEEVA